MKFSTEQLRRLIGSSGPVSFGFWRWGRIESFVFEFEDRHYEASVPVHVTDGWQIRGSLECPEVKLVEKVTREWIPV